MAMASVSTPAIAAMSPFDISASQLTGTVPRTGRAICKAREPKELFLIEGATHIDLYDKPEYVGPAVKKLTTFFEGNLKSR